MVLLAKFVNAKLLPPMSCMISRWVIQTGCHPLKAEIRLKNEVKGQRVHYFFIFAVITTIFQSEPFYCVFLHHSIYKET